MNPTRNDVHIDQGLSNLSIAYMQSEDRFIAGQIFPVVPVDKISDKYFTFEKGDWFRDQAKRRGPGTPSEGGTYRISNDSFNCDVYAFHNDIPHQIEANADAALDLERNSTKLVTQRLLLRREIQFVSQFFTTGVWDTDVTPGNLWDTASSDPEADVDTGRRVILENTGYEPNTLVVGFEVFLALKKHADIRDVYKYTQAGILTTDLLASFFGLKRLLVAKAIKNTANEGATDAFDFVFGKHALLCYVPDAPGLEVPSPGYTFAWTGVSSGAVDADGKPLTSGISRFEIPERKVTRIEGEFAEDMKETGDDLGYFFASVVS